MQENSKDMTTGFQHFGILGAGAWGTALAQTLARAGRDVTLWAHAPALADAMRQLRSNVTYLPGIALDAKIRPTSSLTELQDCNAWLIAVPAQHVRTICHRLVDAAALLPGPVILTSKGIEQNTGALLGDIVALELPQHPVAILSGPSFATEVANGLPAALTLAVKDAALGNALIKSMATPAFRLYLTDDVIGAQIGGAIKNVLAIACGITAGRAMGENARAAIVTRGLAEIIRLGIAAGGRPETLMGLSGVGDLVLTCSSMQSRNMSLGLALGQGKALADILAARSTVAEGVTTAAAALALAQKYGVDMPIITAVNAVLSQNADIDAMITGLLARPLKTEN